MSFQHIVHKNPGTPYNWESPESYRPPSVITADQIVESVEMTYASMAEFSGNDLDSYHDSPPTPRWVRNSRTAWGLAKTAAFFTIVVPTVFGFGSRFVSEAKGYDCPVTAEPSAKDTNNLDKARETVAAMSFGMEKERYVSLKQELDEAKSLDDIQAVLQKGMEPFNVRVELGDLPQAQFGILQTADIREQHNVDLLTVDEARQSTDKLLIGMSQIPASLLKHLDSFSLYLTHSPSIGGKDLGGGYVAGPTIKGRNIILDTSFPDNIDWAFKHELTHVIHQDQCGDDISERQTDGKSDQEFTKNNPEGFIYSQDSKLRDTANKNGVTQTYYAGTAYREDVADTGASLLNGKATNLLVLNKSILNAKQDVISRRFSLVEPDFEAYRRYLGYIGWQPFPKEIAKANSLTTECFQTPGIDDASPTKHTSFRTVPILNYPGQDHLQPADYNFIVLPKTDDKLTYQVGWHKPDGVEKDIQIRQQLGWSLLAELRRNNEIPMHQVNFTVDDYPQRVFGNYVVTCSAISISS